MASPLLASLSNSENVHSTTYQNSNIPPPAPSQSSDNDDVPQSVNHSTAHHSVQCDVKVILEPSESGCVTVVRRWYILTLFCLMCVIQNVSWNTWGPLAQSVKLAFGWSTTVVALMATWGNVTYVLCIVFFSWLMDVKGLRWSCLLSMFLVTLGASLRCITSDPGPATWFIHGAQILNGFGGAVGSAGPPLLSAVWFPAHQRTTATAVCVLSGSLGMSAAFIVGPLLVPSQVISNSTTPNHSTTASGCCVTQMYSLTNHTTVPPEVVATRRDIMMYMYAEAICSGVVLLAMIIYFPAKPPTAPSITATVKRTDFSTGFKRLLRHPAFWKLSICYAVSCGINSAWSSVLDVIINPILPNEVTAGLVGFYGSIAGGFAGCIVARFADYFTRHLKIFLLLLYVVALTMGVVFAVECMAVIPFHIELVYASYILVSIGISAAVPIFFELACESAYPIAEGVTNGLMTMLNNLCGLVFYGVLMLPIGISWMNWAMVASIAVCIPILFTYHERYNRLDVDTMTSEISVTNSNAESAIVVVNDNRAGDVRHRTVDERTPLLAN